MKNVIWKFILLFLFILSSCSSSLDKLITKNWKVLKMEKAIEVVENKYTYVDIPINSKMAYHFMANHKVKMITQIGSNLTGNWTSSDSIIKINVKGQIKQFKVIELTEKKLVLTTGKHKLHLESIK